MAHQFDDAVQQHEAATLGMWIFLGTELMVFGGLFTAYTVYRWEHAVAFQEASGHLLWKLASLNTVVLLSETLTWNEPVGAAVISLGAAVSQGVLRRATVAA